MVQQPFHLSVTTDPKGLGQIRNFIKNAAEKMRLNKKESAGLILAVDETCSNIIRHGYKKASDRQIGINLIPGKNRIQIEIIDDAVSFDLSAAKPGSPDNLEPGGLGIYIIKKVMDEIKYGIDDNGRNKTVLVKYLENN